MTGLAARAPLLTSPATGPGRLVVLIDVDDTIVEVHGYAKQGAGFGYSKVRGLNALLATVATASSAPVIVAQRLRKGSCGSPRGGKRLVADAAAQVRRLLAEIEAGCPLVRMDSAFYGRGPVGAAIAGGCDVSVTVRQDATVKAAIAKIDDDAWIPIEYPDAVFDEPSGRWISRAEVAEISFTAFAPRKPAEQVPGRLVVRRIPELNPTGQDGLFDVWRFHAFFTTSDPDQLDTVAADKTHRGHAIIEQVHADLKNSALAHLPSGRFTANAAWLVLAVMAFNLTRAAACLTGSAAGQSDHRHHPPPADHRPGPDRDLRPPAHACISRSAGPGSTPGPPCSTVPAAHQQSPPPDHPAHAARPGTDVEHPGQRGPAHPACPHPTQHQPACQDQLTELIGGSGLR